MTLEDKSTIEQIYYTGNKQAVNMVLIPDYLQDTLLKDVHSLSNLDAMFNTIAGGKLKETTNLSKYDKQGILAINDIGMKNLFTSSHRLNNVFSTNDDLFAYFNINYNADLEGPYLDVLNTLDSEYHTKYSEKINKAFNGYKYEDRDTYDENTRILVNENENTMASDKYTIVIETNTIFVILHKGFTSILGNSMEAKALFLKDVAEKMFKVYGEERYLNSDFFREYIVSVLKLKIKKDDR